VRLPPTALGYKLIWCLGIHSRAALWPKKTYN